MFHSGQNCFDMMSLRLILANLRSPDRPVRKLALRTAARVVAPAFRPALLEALSSPRVLGHMRSPRALAFLAAQASSGHLDDRYAVARALDAGRFRASDNQVEALWNHGLDAAECLDRLDRIRVGGTTR
jgi:hypothetical protein